MLRTGRMDGKPDSQPFAVPDRIAGKAPSVLLSSKSTREPTANLF